MHKKFNFKAWAQSEEHMWKSLVVRSEIDNIKIFTNEAKKEFPKAKDKHKFIRYRSLLAYRRAERNSWIYLTLAEKKKLSLFKECKNLILVGCGMYPYSMFDIHKKHKHIKQVGIEIDKNRALIAKEIVNNSPAKEMIDIVNLDGADYDYSSLNDEDLIFISCDVRNEEIISNIIEKSKAHFFICAPYNKEWLKKSMLKLGIAIDEHGNIIRRTDIT